MSPSPLHDTSVSDANRAGYDRWAEAYDGGVNSTVAADELAFPPVWAHLHDRDVLEIGCGTGRHTLRLVMAGNRVTGLDLSPGMLAIAREKLKGLDGVRLIEADIMTADATGSDLFDAAITALVIEHIGDLPKFFGAVAERLKGGSRFYLSEIHPSRMQAGSGARFEDAKTGEVTWLASFAHTADAVVDAAATVGFVLVSETDHVADAAFVARHPGWEKYLNKPMVRIWVFEKA